MSKQLICSACGHVGNAKGKVKGNLLIEIILWLCFLIPGIIYSLWRGGTRYKACTVCGSTNLIPVDSPVGQKLLADQGKNVEEVVAEGKASNRQAFKKRLIIYAAIIGFMSLSLLNLF